MNDKADLYLDLLKKCLSASLYDESAWRIVEAFPQGDIAKRTLLSPIRAVLIRSLRKHGFMLVRERPFDAAKREVGEDWPCFGFTMIGKKRLDNLHSCIQDVLEHNIPGDFMETGIWRGGAVIFMRAALKAYGAEDRLVWAADSFAGMPPPKDKTDGWNLNKIEQLKVSLEQVKNNFARFGLLDERIRFLKGWFSDTLPTAPINKLAILRLDGDLYHSTMDSLCNLYLKVSPGGYVIVDDYYSWEGCRRAVHEFFQRNGIHPTIKPIDNEAVYWQV